MGGRVSEAPSPQSNRIDPWFPVAGFGANLAAKKKSCFLPNSHPCSFVHEVIRDSYCFHQLILLFAFLYVSTYLLEMLELNVDVLDLIDFEMKQTKKKTGKKLIKKKQKIYQKNKPVKVLVSEMTISDDLMV